MSEERTQAPSKRRRQQARERGQVARSPDLTGAVGVLAAVVLLGGWGGDLTTALIAAVREPFVAAPSLTLDATQAVARLRQHARAIAGPLAIIIGGVVATMFAAHQVQVGGLWVPGLLAPEPRRFWAIGPGAPARVGRGAWALAKAIVVVLVAAWALGTDLAAFHRLGGLDPLDLATASARRLQGLAYRLALAMLGLGLVDYVLQHRRIEALLRLTPDEHREDQKAIDGDPAWRARRLRVARSWRRDPAEVLAGSALVLTGAGGLTVVLAGGPPPGRVLVRSVAKGAEGATLQRAAERAGVVIREAPDLARHFATGPASGRVLPPDLAAVLAAAWPARGGAASR